MNLNKKKRLASKVLKVGVGRIVFAGNLNEIKEAITRQDILDLYKMKAIKIKDIKGRRKIKKRKHKRGEGKIKKRVNKKEREYINLTRKLRKNALVFLKTKKINKEQYRKIRKMIKSGSFKSKRHMNESLGDM